MVLIVFGAIILLAIWYFISAEFMSIAEMKGHKEKRYFWWTFLCSFVGIAMVIALPDRTQFPTVVTAPAEKAEVISDELPDL